MEHQDPFEVLSTEELLAAGLICDEDMDALFPAYSAADEQAHSYADYVEAQVQAQYEEMSAEELEALEMAA